MQADETLVLGVNERPGAHCSIDALTKNLLNNQQNLLAIDLLINRISLLINK